MGRICRYIILSAFLAIVLSSCSKDVRIIPRKDLALIYHDMFVADAWLARQENDLRDRTDSVNFYEPIFKAYGYTTTDYLAATEYYLEDPKRFERIVKTARDMLSEELIAVSEEIDSQARRREKSDRLAYMSSRYVLYRDALRDMPFYDRVNILKDSTGRYYPARTEEEFTYSGPEILMKETEPADTVGRRFGIENRVTPGARGKMINKDSQERLVLTGKASF